MADSGKQLKWRSCLRRGRWILAAFALAAVLLRAQQATPWNYAGAKHWGELDPAYAACGSGRQQSPIDIGHAVSAVLPALRFEYHSGPLAIVNNGHSVQLDLAPGSGNLLFVGGERYELVQLHFHHPSEEEFGGRAAAMDIHLVHRSPQGRLLVAAVQLVVGAGDAALAGLWPHLPATAGPEHTVAGVGFNPAALLPASTAYYTYAGSLTTPPCSEGVTWVILQTPVSLSEAQLAAFAQLYPDNARPVQPLHGRVVRQSH